MIGLSLAMAALLVTPPVASSADSVRIELAVAGMTCGSCAVTARVVLRRIQGVIRAEVSYDSARAVIWYDPARVTPDRIITELRERTGYAARVMNAPRQVREEEWYAKAS